MQLHEDADSHLFRQGEKPQGPSQFMKRKPEAKIDFTPAPYRPLFDGPPDLLFKSQSLRVVTEDISRPGAQVNLRIRGSILHAFSPCNQGNQTCNPGKFSPEYSTFCRSIPFPHI